MTDKDTIDKVLNIVNNQYPKFCTQCGAKRGECNCSVSTVILIIEQKLNNIVKEIKELSSEVKV